MLKYVKFGLDRTPKRNLKNMSVMVILCQYMEY